MGIAREMQQIKNRKGSNEFNGNNNYAGNNHNNYNNNYTGNNNYNNNYTGNNNDHLANKNNQNNSNNQNNQNNQNKTNNQNNPNNIPSNDEYYSKYYNYQVKSDEDFQKLSNKHENLINEILQEEEDFIGQHKGHIDEMVDMVKQVIYFISIKLFYRKWDL